MSVIDDTTRLRHMLEAAQKITQYADGKGRDSLDHDEVLQLALIRLVEIIGEAAARVSTEFQATHPEIAWSALKGMRNRLIHAYFKVDMDVLWETVTISVPALIEQLEKIHLKG